MAVPESCCIHTYTHYHTHTHTHINTHTDHILHNVLAFAFLWCIISTNNLSRIYNFILQFPLHNNSVTLQYKQSTKSLLYLTSVSLTKPLLPAVSKMIFTPFLIVILIIIPSVSELIVNLIVVLHTTYLTRQGVDHIFVTTCKSMIDFVNLLINKRWRCLSFYKSFANFGKDFCCISLTQLVSLPLEKL